MRQEITLVEAKREADYAIDEGANLDPYNESRFRYLIGLLKEEIRQDEIVKEELLTEYQGKVWSLRDILTDRDPDTCTNLTSAMIDMLEMQGDAESLQRSKTLAQGLADEHDTIRKMYWLLRVQEMEQALQQ